MMPPPIDLLCGLLLLTAAAAVANRQKHRREQRVYRQLAVEHQMHFTPADSLSLTPRIAAHLPLPGAAAVRVIDLLFRTDEKSHHYVFTVEYTLGAMGRKQRVRRAGALTEEKSGSVQSHAIRLAPAGLPLVEQYRILIIG